MQCPRCQAQNPSDAVFCEECGARLEAPCSTCGEPNRLGAKFCKKCGQRLTPGGFPGPMPSRKLGSPEAYIPKHLAEKILTSKSALEGERKQVTVLFADLKGSMELLADRDPEEARKLLDPVLERMMEAVHRYEGTVNQVMGDGIMALFGAPVAHEDHAVRACYAALRMQESLREYADGVRRTEGIPIQIRVGLNSGEVVVRSIGSDLRMDYTAVGQTTHLAARMEQMAVPGSVLVTADTLHLAEGYVQVKPLGPMTVKGLSDPVDAYELTGTGVARSRFQAAATRGLSRFVGRDTEIEQFRRVLERARQGRGQVAGVVGEPGVGKSRLVFEIIHSHRVEGWLVLESGSVSYGKATSYLPVTDLLKGYFRIGDRDTQRDIREKVTGKVLALDRNLEPTLAALLALLNVSVEDPAWQALDPPQRRQRTLDAVKRLLLREAKVQPLLLVFEDLHWIDSETQALLDGLVESLPTARVLLLVNYRPEYSHGWGGKTYYTQLRLDTLPAESASELLDALLGLDASLAPLKDLLATKTGGNPLFLEEGVRTLVETKALLGERGAYRLAQPVEAVQVPATVQAILASRIDRLPSDEKRLLQTAAVIGKDFLFALLQAIADESEEKLRHGLSHLQSAEFLYETSLFPDLEYTFKHALTHEVAYRSLLQERRRTLHARIIGVIETLYPDRLAEQVERLAHHAVRGELWEKAICYLREAAMKALKRWANHAAVAHLEEALTHLVHLPEGRNRFAVAIDIRLALRNALVPLGDSAKSFTYLQEAASLAERLQDAPRIGWASAYMAHYFWIAGQAEKSRTYAQRAYEIAESCSNHSLKIRSSLYLGFGHQTSGDYERAATFYRGIAQAHKGDVESYRAGPTTHPVATALAFLVRCLADRGEFEEGVARGRDAVRISELADQMFNLIQALWSLGYLYQIRGEFRSAMGTLERGLELTQQWGVTFFIPYLSCSLGHVYTLMGQTQEGLRLSEQGLAMTESLEMEAFRSLFLVELGGASLHADRIEAAATYARKALMLAQGRGERGHEAYALHLLGSIAAQGVPQDHEAAERQFQQTVTLASDLGMRPLIARCHLGLGQLYQRGGRPEQVRTHLTTARTMFREMDMGFWLEKTEAELKKPR